MAQLIGQGAIAFGYTNTSNPISQTSPQPGSPPAAGQIGRDASGNVYILCDPASSKKNSHRHRIEHEQRAKRGER